MECNNSSSDEQPTKVGIKATGAGGPAAQVCKCGSATHKRTNHSDCPLNKRDWVVKPKKKKEKRKNVEHNGFELIVALCALDPALQTFEHILSASFKKYEERLRGCTKENFEKYKADTLARTESEVENYIKNFHMNFQSTIKGDVKYVYLEGKNLRTEKLIKLNKGIDRKKAKADVYIECVEKSTFNGENKMYGFSVKQDKSCTKTNYSVEKILVELCGEEEGKNLIKEMTTLRRNILKKVGIDEKNYKQHQRGGTNKANQLFYDSLEGTNPYWNSMRESLEKNLNTVAKVLVNNLFPTELPYKLYEFDGTKFENLNGTTSSIVEFVEHKHYYYKKKKGGLVRKAAAKMFYRLVVNEKTYRVEIRFKGNALSSSPQFQIHSTSN